MFKITHPRMKEGKFSQGPWTQGLWHRGYGNFVYQGLDRSDEQRIIAICEFKQVQHGWDEVFSNAALIASAPQVLNALLVMRDTLAAVANPNAQAIKPALEIADEAIAQAFGEDKE